MSDNDLLTNALAKSGQPQTFFKALDAFLQSAVGHIYMTLLVVDGDDVLRVYTSDTERYPVAGRKRMGPTPWGDHVIKGQKPYLATDTNGIRWAFFDHALMESMGVGSAINMPIVYDGQCIGTLNLNAAEHHYGAAHVDIVASIVPFLIPAFLKPSAAIS